MKKQTDVGLLILRISIGGLMLLHGLAKMTKSISGLENKIVESGLPGVLAYGVYLGEIVAPLLLIVGFRSKIAALFISFTMLVAIYVSQDGNLLERSPTGASVFEAALLFGLGALALFFTGAGKYAVSTKNKWD